MRRGSLRNVSIAYPGTLGVTTEKGQQDVKPLVLDHMFDGYDLAMLRWNTGVFEVGASPPPEPVQPLNYVIYLGEVVTYLGEPVEYTL